jgi:hypothetical protein
MPWDDPIDPDTPGDNDPLSHGDDRIRELKRALNERLSTVIAGWPDADPLKLKFAALDDLGDTVVSLKRGLLEDRPNPPDSDFYWATDTKRFFIDEGGTWQLVAAGAISGGGSSVPVGFDNLKTKSASTVAGLTVANGTTTHLVTIDLEFLGVPHNTHLLLALSGQVKPDGIANYLPTKQWGTGLATKGVLGSVTPFLRMAVTNVLESVSGENTLAVEITVEQTSGAPMNISVLLRSYWLSLG